MTATPNKAAARIWDWALTTATRSTGWVIQAKASALLAHEESAYDEWDASLQARLDPGAQGRGITFTLEPGWTDDGRSQKMGMDFSNALGKWSKARLCDWS